MALEQGWRSKDAPAHYANIVDVVVPARKDILAMIAGLSRRFTSEEPNVLDVGCGFGDVTAEVLRQMPAASVTMVDYSAEMIRLATERFSGLPNVQIIQHDLNDGLPEALGPASFNAAVSCFVVHHVKPDRRAVLYAEIRQRLKPSGIFVNGDLFRAEDDAMNDWEFDQWIELQVRRIQEVLGQETTFAEVKTRQLESFRKLGDMPGTVWAMQSDLRQAGFQTVDCLWKFQNIAVLAAMNRAAIAC